MLVTFISECEKKANNRTRRVLDAFANRIGNNTWQTPITSEGLAAVQKLLRQTASKSTAVSCHQLKSRTRTQLLWIIGNRDKFNSEGIVAVNYTEQDISQFMDKNNWKTIEVIKYASAIAGLFHDFGKANNLFQNKLKPDKKKAKGQKNYEPYRHEWVSLRLFQAFVGDKNDIGWLESLSQLEKGDFPRYFKDGIDGFANSDHPIDNLPSFAKLVAWLIVTHHRLPLYPKWKNDYNSVPNLRNVNDLFINNFNGSWNSYNCKDEDQKNRLEENWQCKKMPTDSYKWRTHSSILSSKALIKLRYWLKKDNNTDWLNEELFTTHLSRVCLILADHYYSSLSIDNIKEEYRSVDYQVWANTDRETKAYKQQLDEHLIGVAYNSKSIGKALLNLNGSLRSLKTLEHINKKVIGEFEKNFGWQNDAKKLSKEIGKSSIDNGFFGINMASTGKGKTMANAKIMTAIGSEIGRIRFSVALGLRTLTLQTGREYRTELKLTAEDLAIMVGGTAVKQLFENEQYQEGTGSESENDCFSTFKIDYKGEFYDHSLSNWTKEKEQLNKLIQAPVLVSTIDHLIPATDGVRGDKHIPATLRLLTSDLVLDEPDDFGLDDLPALCRLVNWAGMLGSRVLLSTATMPPALANALFLAYRQGWKQYAKANIDNWNSKITCAWFDEKNCKSEQCKTKEEFKDEHNGFVKKRIKELQKITKVKRKGEILDIINSENSTIVRMAETIYSGINKLHNRHKISKNNKNISIGLVRMANINPLVAVAKELLKKDAPKNTRIHYCIYHGRYPLAVRSYIENKLDKILNRKEEDKVWDNAKNIIDKYPKIDDHIFVVIASPVAEVGRDHDYDWAVVEPSSMRSIIQIAGRVLRHRSKTPKTPNILLLNENYKALKKENICFEYPGFESKNIAMKQHNLTEVLNENQYKEINAIQRIVLPEEYKTEKEEYLKLVELEHKALSNKLFSDENGAKIWWEKHSTWCGEMQRQQKFRDSKKDEGYYLCIKNKHYEPYWQWKNEDIYPAEFGEPTINIRPCDKINNFGINSCFWFDLDVRIIYSKLAEDFDINLEKVSHQFGEVRLVEYKNSYQEYAYHHNLGLYKILSE